MSLVLGLCFLASTLLVLIAASKYRKSGSFHPVSADSISILNFFQDRHNDKILEPINSDGREKKDYSLAMHYLSVLTEQSLRERHLETSENDPSVSVSDKVLRLEIVFLALKSYSNDDRTVFSSLTLLSLIIAGDRNIRSMIFQNGRLHTTIRAIRDSLSRAKLDDTPTERAEQLSAQVQRKSCLLLGGLADDDPVAADTIVNAGGLTTIINAMEWYRFHSGVCTWALWAIFNISYDQPKTQEIFLKEGGIQAVCEVLKNITNCIDVSRHGVAIFYDIMREKPGNASQSAHALMIGVKQGLQEILKDILDKFPANTELTMMSQQILHAVDISLQK